MTENKKSTLLLKTVVMPKFVDGVTQSEVHCSGLNRKYMLQSAISAFVDEQVKENSKNSIRK